jgi:predicted DNA-binding ribbon-helix-helix protein
MARPAAVLTLADKVNALRSISNLLHRCARERFAMHTTSIRLEPEIWAEVERRAKRERRPVSNLLRIIVTDAINPPPAAGGQDGALA